jgi:hypothetical protein
VAKHHAKYGQKGAVRRVATTQRLTGQPKAVSFLAARGTMSSGRSETRILKTVSVEVYPVDDPRLKERTLTENVSVHGVRVVMQRSLRPRQQAVVISANEGVWSRANVVYCQRAAENRLPSA